MTVFFLLSLWTEGACIPVSGPHILARDLVAEVPALAATPPETKLSYAPAPGLSRRLEPAELRRMLRRIGLESASRLDPVCVQTETPRHNRAAIAAAMQRSLPPGVSVAVGEVRGPGASHYEFSVDALRGLPAATDGSVVWRGWSFDSQSRSSAVAVKVRLSAIRCMARARREIRVGTLLTAEDLEETCALSRWSPEMGQSRQVAVGLEAQRTIRAGAEISPAALRAPVVIEPGARVEVRSFAGPVSIIAEAVAEGRGALGGQIWLRGKSPGSPRFRARVVGAHRAEMGSLPR
jgi:flagella basal body P-ring formation protein FlgA